MLDFLLKLFVLPSTICFFLFSWVASQFDLCVLTKSDLDMLGKSILELQKTNIKKIEDKHNENILSNPK